MRILWIVNTLLSLPSEKLYNKKSNGLWMDAYLKDFVGKDGYEIAVATTSKIKKTVAVKDKNVTYYILPDDYPINYDENKISNVKAWRSLLTEFRPDLIEVWGTEFTHGLCALRVAKNLSVTKSTSDAENISGSENISDSESISGAENITITKGIPSVIFMQGVMTEIADGYYGGLSLKEVNKYRSLRDDIKHDGIMERKAVFYRQSFKEKEMLSITNRAISENFWCDDKLKKINPDIRIYRLPLCLNNAFYRAERRADGIEKHSVIVTASGYPLKGLHIMLRAAAILKDEYPDIKIYVPGASLKTEKGIKNVIHRTGYAKYITEMINRYGLNENVVWLGNLSQEELAERYCTVNAFVMCSLVENHSSSLKEAMLCGVPSVTTKAGGIPEYAVDGRNAFVYDFDDVSALAGALRTIFEDESIAKRLSENARADMRNLHKNEDLFKISENIYRDIVKENCR